MHDYPVLIISGGQTGVDRAALQVARELGLPTGGWCPPGRLAEDGLIPAEFPLRETPVERSNLANEVPRSQRTEWNVRDADGTLILFLTSTEEDPGTQWTKRAAGIYQKPLLEINLTWKAAVDETINWIRENQIRKLNIAGPAESGSPGIGKAAESFLRALLAIL
jgi:hypothetical protein